MKLPKYDSGPLFISLCKRAGLAVPTREFPFAKHYTPQRKWRFDYAWIDAKVALEVEGGAWSRGRHTRGSGFLEDMVKYNAATLGGWRVLRTTPDKLTDIETLKQLGQALGVTVAL